MIYVIAKYFDDFLRWCQDHGRAPTEVVHVKHRRQLQGVVIRPEDEIVKIGPITLEESILASYAETRRRPL